MFLQYLCNPMADLSSSDSDLSSYVISVFLIDKDGVSYRRISWTIMSHNIRFHNPLLNISLSFAIWLQHDSQSCIFFLSVKHLTILTFCFCLWLFMCNYYSIRSQLMVDNPPNYLLYGSSYVQHIVEHFCLLPRFGKNDCSEFAMGRPGSDHK